MPRTPQERDAVDLHETRRGQATGERKAGERSEEHEADRIGAFREPVDDRLKRET